jgi:type IV pilus assembly protein PilC
MADKKDALTAYAWSGVNKRGEKVSGVQDARSTAILKADLRKQGIMVKKVAKKTKPLFSKRSKKIQPQDIAVFTRQMSTMMESGIPLIQSFDIVAKGQVNEKMTNLILEIKTSVESGLTLAESLKKHPDYFNDLYCNLIDAGEQSGALEIMLDNLASYKEKVESIKKKIKKALFYPIAVLIIAFLVSAALLIFVVPQFEELFKGFGADLPGLTRVVIDMSEFFQAYWYLIFGILVGLGWGFIYLKKNSTAFAYQLDKFSLKFPIIGQILQKAAIARFSRTLSITFAAGMPLVDALKSVSGATGNILYADATRQIKEEVSTGQQMQFAMKKTNLFPNMVIQMIAIGEESGSLESMLLKVADFYEEEVDAAVDALSSLLEPLIMAVLGVMVGGLVVAMYMPIFKLGAVV